MIQKMSKSNSKSVVTDPEAISIILNTSVTHIQNSTVNDGTSNVLPRIPRVNTIPDANNNVSTKSISSNLSGSNIFFYFIDIHPPINKVSVLR